MISERRHIYFVQARQLRLIKIGVANDAIVRLRGLGMGSPDRLRVLGVMLCWKSGVTEECVHRLFAADRVHGEWFKPSAALMEYIDQHTWDMSIKFRARLQDALDEPQRKKGRKPRSQNDRETKTVDTGVNFSPPLPASES